MRGRAHLKVVQGKRADSCDVSLRVTGALCKAKAEAGDYWENGAGGWGLAESVGVLRLRLPR